MGCGASTGNTDETVPNTLQPQKNIASDRASGKKSAQSGANNTLSKPVVPSISGEKKTGHSIAFEIPIDDLITKNQQKMAATKVSLPALSLSQQDIQAKLANTEERWKVGAQLDHLLYGDIAAAGDETKKRRKPKLRSQNKKEQDPEALKIRLHEREVAAQFNREREINKLQLKLARQEEHARKVLERKRAMGGANDEMRLSWGGEKGLAELTGSSDTNLDSTTTSDLKSSGNGNGANRGSSGRSATTDTTEVDAPVAAPVNPLKSKGLNLQGLAPKSRFAAA